jgi:hypothetical protein
VTTLDAPRAPPARFADDDLEHLRLLSVFHYVVAGMMALASLVPGVQLTVGLLLATGRIGAADDGSEAFGWLMASCASFLVILGLSIATLVAIAGRGLARHRSYTYCLVVAGFLCLAIPFGTLLGVFTIIVLVKPTVRALFGVDAPSSTP